MRFWVSWIQPTEDYRPLNFPPNSAIKGWWCSGECSDGATLCAVIDTETTLDVTKAVILDWPEAMIEGKHHAYVAWRFLRNVSDNWTPGPSGDESRFPITDWMIERFEVSDGI